MIITSNLEEEFQRARRGAERRATVESRDPPPRPYFRTITASPLSVSPRTEEQLTPVERRALQRTAQTPGLGGYGDPNIEWVGPDIVGPLFEPINFYLPYTYKVLNRWIRYYLVFHPYVGNCISMHAEIPIGRFTLTGVEDEKVLQEYEEIFEKIDLFQNLFYIAKEYWGLGEAYPFLHWNDTEQCFDQIVLLNPDYINVVATPLAYGENVQLELEPDEYLIGIIKSDDPRSQEIREKLDPIIIESIESGQNIPLDSFNVTQIARKEHPYDLRGTSIVLRCLRELLYEDHLRRAQFAIAQRHITPLRIFQLGDPQGEWIPSSEDIDAFAHLLAQAAYDPNFALIGNYALRVEYVGSTGKILPILPEFEFVERRILAALFTNKAMIHGEGPCLSEDSEVLTLNGWKRYTEVKPWDKIATVNPETFEIEYHRHQGKVAYHFEGELIEFESDFVNQLATPNHRCLLSRDAVHYEVVRADEATSHFALCDLVWDGKPLPPTIHLEAPPSQHASHEWEVETPTFLELLGAYAAVGISYKHFPSSRVLTSMRLTVSRRNKFLDELCDRVPFMLRPYNYREKCWWYTSIDASVATAVATLVGRNAKERFIDQSIKNLPPFQLRFFVEGFLKACNIDPSLPRGSVKVSTKRFADDLQEVFLKLGYTAKVERGDKWIVSFSKIVEDKRPRITVRRRPYSGTVFSFEVPNHFFIARRNGKPIVTGNTYANASVAFEVLQLRYLALRGLLELWVRNKLARPIAEARGYYKRTKAELDHKVRNSEPKLLLPEINWLEKMNLVDDVQQKNFLVRLRERGEIPLRLLCDVFNLDYGQVIKWLKEEIGTVADPVYRQRLEQILSQEQSSKPPTPTTPTTPTTSPLPTVPPLGLASKKAKSESRRKVFGERRRAEPVGGRKVFGPKISSNDTSYYVCEGDL